jgi:hypothetical protein
VRQTRTQWPRALTGLIAVALFESALRPLGTGGEVR